MHVNVSGRSVLLFNKLIDWLIDLYLLAYHRSYACSSLWASWSIQPFGHSGKEGLLCPFWGELGPHLTQRPDSSLRYRRYINHLLTYLQCGQRRGLPPCQVTSWSMHTALWPQQTWAESWGGCCGPLWGGKRAGSPYVTQCGLGRGLRPYQVASYSMQPFGHNTWAKTGGAVPLPLGGRGLHLTMSPGLRPTSVPSGISYKSSAVAEMGECDRGHNSV